MRATYSSDIANTSSMSEFYLCRPELLTNHEEERSLSFQPRLKLTQVLNSPSFNAYTEGDYNASNIHSIYTELEGMFDTVYGR